MPKSATKSKKSKKSSKYVDDSSSSSALTEDGPSTGFTCIDDDSDNLSIGGVSFDGSTDGRSLGGRSTDTNENLDDADDLCARVEQLLADFDGPIDDPELKALQEALAEAQESMENAREKAKEAEEERAADLEAAKDQVKLSKRRNRERAESMEENDFSGDEAEEKRHLQIDSDDEDLDRSGHEIDAMNKRFQDQVGRVRRKCKKREALAAQMKLGAKKAVRKLRHAEIAVRRAKEDADRKAKEAKKNQVDMSESARRSRVYSCYTQYGMPSKDKLKPLVAKMPKSSGVSVDDIDLLPWDEHGRRVNMAKLNQVLSGLKQADW